MNMGIADGVDLGWKLAAVLQGWGGARLLDSYERERRPIHEAVLNESVANHSVLSNQLVEDGQDSDDAHGASVRDAIGRRIQQSKVREFSTLGVVLGYRYDDSPVILADGSERAASDFVNYVPSSRPGALAPHAWLHDGTSLYDHFGAGFTLLASPDVPEEAIDQARHQASARRVPLTVLQPGEAGVQSLYPTRLTLIRPDQHIAWRGNAWPAMTVDVFGRACGMGKATGGVSA